MKVSATWICACAAAGIGLAAMQALAQPASPPLGGAPAPKTTTPPAAPSVKSGAGGGPTSPGSGAPGAPGSDGGPPPPPSVILNPAWTQMPTAEDILRAYPPRALAQGVEGRAIMTCRVAEDGGLETCEAREMPEGQGFGDAAKALAAKFKLLPVTPSGFSVVGARVSIPVNFTRAPPATRP